MGQPIPSMQPLPPPHATSSAAYRERYRTWKQIYMAKSEIKKRTLNVFSNLWWKYVPGTTVTVKWPVGWVVLNEMDDGSKVSTESADPNDHYRPWLEKHVGKQGWDWDWRIGQIAGTGRGIAAEYDTVAIKFRKKHAPLASVAALKWS